MKRIKGENGIICRLPGERNGYFGWPTVTRLDDGSLVVACSGLRRWHICPYGKTVLFFSQDEGKSWSVPRVINNSPLDDRDAGIINSGGKAMLVTWFTSHTWQYLEGLRQALGVEEVSSWKETLKGQQGKNLTTWLGCWSLLSLDGGESRVGPFPTPCNTPHGPVRLSSGQLLYLGKACPVQNHDLPVICATTNDGRCWETIGQVPSGKGTENGNYFEPHVVVLASGKLLGLIRVERLKEEQLQAGFINFSLFQTESTDGGRNWTVPKPTRVYGSPPHLILHSSGKIICVYGYRRPPYGQRAMFSSDGGKTWDADWIIRDDGPDHDLGYPSSVEMPDGSIFTVYYQKVRAEEKCSLLYTRRNLP